MVLDTDCSYNTYYKVLNALDYNIPQHRQRIYAISIREDIDNNPEYKVNYTDNKYYIHYFLIQSYNH